MFQPSSSWFGKPDSKGSKGDVFGHSESLCGELVENPHLREMLKNAQVCIG